MQRSITKRTQIDVGIENEYKRETDVDKLTLEDTSQRVLNRLKKEFKNQ